MIFTFGSFKIDVDVEATRAFYDRAPSLIVPCACNGCRNFQLAIRQTPDEVQRFFSDLGADIASPAETWTWDVVPEESGTHLWYGGFYNLCGEILAGDGQWKPQHKDSCIYQSGCPPITSLNPSRFHSKVRSLSYTPTSLLPLFRWISTHICPGCSTKRFPSPSLSLLPGGPSLRRSKPAPWHV